MDLGDLSEYGLPVPEEGVFSRLRRLGLAPLGWFDSIAAPCAGKRCTAGAGSLFAPLIEAGAERGLRHVSYARPGYSGSDRDAGRTVAACAGDVAAIADALEVERFYSTGQSGGGPHSLACAALLGDRVYAAAVTASVAPLNAEGLDWVDGMGQENLDEFAAMQAGPPAVSQRADPEPKEQR